MRLKGKLIFLLLGLFTFFFAMAYGQNTDAKSGLKVFDQNCAVCHQKGGGGKIGLAPSIRNRDFLAIASDEFITNTIRRGREGTSMPARGDLKENEIKSIIAYLRSLPVANPIKVQVDWDKKVKGDHKKGKKTFAHYCSSCHGPKGEGYTAGGSGPAIGFPGFLATASDDYIIQTLKRGRVGTPMKSFMGAKGLANLNESDVHNIIAYLRVLGKINKKELDE